MRYYAASGGAPYLYHPLPKASEGSGDFEGGGSNSNLENSINWELDPATTKAVAPSPLERGSRQGLGKVISHLVFSANIAKLNIKICDKLPKSENFGIPVLSALLVFCVEGDFDQCLVVFMEQRRLILGVS